MNEIDGGLNQENWYSDNRGDDWNNRWGVGMEFIQKASFYKYSTNIW